MSDASGHKIISVGRQTRDIFEGPDSRLVLLRKAVAAPGGSNQGGQSGVQAHLMNKTAARDVRDMNTTHAACLEAKAGSTAALGHRDETIHEILNPLTVFSWQDVLSSCTEDYWEGGDAYFEAVRGDGDDGPITGLHHLAGDRVHVVLEQEDNARDFHYQVIGEGGETLAMARFGDLADLKKRNANSGTVEARTLTGRIANSEIIHIRQPNNRSRYYGFPDYMSAVPSAELVQCMTQHEFDFYFNRGVPEFLLLAIGSAITGPSWEEITKVIKASQGLGNSHKTAAIHLPGTPADVSVEVVKLAMEDAANSGFSEKAMTLAMQIATAHGVPPILANILLPGKIGAANEGPNALHLIQVRKLGPAQRNFSQMLAQTLGHPDTKLAGPTGGAKKIEAKKFLDGGKGTDDNGLPIFSQAGNGFRTVLDGMTLGERDTMASMKEPLAGSGRNPADGKLKGTDDRKPTDPRRTR